MESDTLLMLRHSRGDRAAMGLLFDRHVRGVHALLLSMLHDGSAADDLVQTTFLSLIRFSGDYDPERPLVPWLLSIAANAARDSLRQRKHEAKRDAEAAHEPAPVFQVPSDSRVRRLIESAFKALPVTQQHCVSLHQLEGLSFSRIAAVLDISEGAARTRAHRGCRSLRQRLASLDR